MQCRQRKMNDWMNDWMNKKKYELRESHPTCLCFTCLTFACFDLNCAHLEAMTHSLLRGILDTPGVTVSEERWRFCFISQQFENVTNWILSGWCCRCYSCSLWNISASLVNTFLFLFFRKPFRDEGKKKTTKKPQKTVYYSKQATWVNNWLLNA